MTPVTPSDVAGNEGLLTKTIGVLGTIIAGLGAIVMRNQEQRLGAITAELATKADATDVERQSEHIGKLFDECKAIRKEIADGRVENVTAMQSLERTIRDSIDRRTMREDG